MSLAVQWDLIDDDVCLQLQHFLNDRISSFPLPAILRSLSVDKLNLGSNPPNIAILDMQYPFSELYDIAQLDLDENKTAASSVHDGRLPPPPIPSPTDTQLLLHVAYKGNLSLTINATVAVDIPGGAPSNTQSGETNGFISLPIELHLRGLELDVIVMVAWVGGDRICWSFLESEDERQNTSIIRAVTFDTTIGDNDKKQPQSLKNIQWQLEKFLIDTIHKALDSELVWPNYYTIFTLGNEQNEQRSPIS